MEKADPGLSWDSWFTSFAGRQAMAKYVGFGGFCCVFTGRYFVDFLQVHVFCAVLTGSHCIQVLVGRYLCCIYRQVY